VLTALALQVPIVGAVIGGLLTFIALVVLGPLLVPRMGSWVMAGPGRRGPVARIARANVVRYPSRSARTSAAVLLGVALAASTTALVSTLDSVQALDSRNELSVFAPTVTDGMAADLAAVDGIVEVWQPNASEAVAVFAGPRAEAEAAAAAAITDWPGARIGTAEDRTSELAGALRWIAAILGAVAVMSLLVGSVGVLNTVRLTIAQRQREFAVLRAVGMTRGQLLRMVVAEAAGLTGIGVVMGLVLAAATIYGMLGMATLLILPLISWWLVALVCVGLIAVVAAGSLLPARSAARIPPAVAVAQTAQ